MRRVNITIFAAFAAAAIGAPLTIPAASAGQVAHSRVVSEDPVDYTPHVLNGRVYAIEVVGDTVIVGGAFSKVKEAGAFFATERRHIFAFDAQTGEIRTGFDPQLDGPVEALEAGPGGTVYVGGAFSLVNGRVQRGLTRLSVETGRTVPSFADTSLASGVVTSLAVGDWLYVGGRFGAVNGTERHALARVGLRSGNVDKSFTMHVRRPRKGALIIKDLALSPSHSKLVIDGNFTRVAGKRRHQIAMIDTGGGGARLANWATDAYTDKCTKHFNTYMRGVDFAPSGSYFVVVTTGGEVRSPTAMCDSAARFESGARGTDIEPTWVNRTGGDSLYSVAATGAAVYIGGHQRWVSNPRGKSNKPGPGAVPRQGIAALHPRTGEALAWNPSRTRGHGAEALLPTPIGLYVGSDTTRLGHEDHGRIGMFPIKRSRG